MTRPPFIRKRQLAMVYVGIGICLFHFLVVFQLHFFHEESVAPHAENSNRLLDADNDSRVVQGAPASKPNSNRPRLAAGLSKTNQKNEQKQVVESLKRIRKNMMAVKNKKKAKKKDPDKGVFGVLQKDPNDMKLRFREDPGDGRPPFSSIVDKKNDKITGDVSDLLQYAIVGFGKCGTTTMRDWLNTHPKIQCYPDEVYDMMQSNVPKVIERVYSMPPGNFTRGFKSPLDASQVHAMKYYGKYFPKAKLIVALRHPVRWFESLYNFRIQNLRKSVNLSEFPTPNKAVGKCRPHSFNTCTFKGQFALFLRNLGKTAHIYNSTFERSLHTTQQVDYEPIEPLPNQVLLFDIRQLKPDHSAKTSLSSTAQADAAAELAQFRHDLVDFLEVDDALSTEIPHFKPGAMWQDAEVQARKNAAKIDICEEQYVKVRRALMQAAKTTAAYIQTYLLPLADNDDNKSVVFANRPQFERLLEDWKHDPCGPNNETESAAKRLLRLLPQ